MDWFIVVVGLLLLVLATPIALGWWYLARKAAPYGDEKKAKSGKRPAQDHSEVIVLSPSDKPRSAGKSG